VLYLMGYCWRKSGTFNEKGRRRGVADELGGLH
jgi:hypothetical protein